MCDMTPEEERACFDKHAKDGCLSKKQLRCMVKEQMGDDFKGCKNPRAMRKLFDAMDENDDGKLSFEEFHCFLEQVKKVKGGADLDLDEIKSVCDMNDEELQEIFEKRAKCGKLSKRQVKCMVKKTMGDEFKGAKNKDKMKEQFRKMDEDGDGALDFEEFKKAVGCIKQVRDSV